MPFLSQESTPVIINPDLPTDALSSKQFNTLVEILSEGEIEGSATASKNGITNTASAEYKNSFLKDIFLNNTQVLQEAANVTSPTDSTFNFKNVEFDFRLGSSSQSFIKGVEAVETEVGIGTVVTTSVPVTHTVNSNTIDAVRVTIRFASLQKFEDDGNIKGTEVNLKIKAIENNGTTTTVVDDVVKGRTTNAYFRDYRIRFKDTTSFPVQIRVERVTADSTDSKLINAFSFHSATDIIFEQNSYPNTAHILLRFNAEQFPRVPRRMFRIRGIKVKIPNNASVNIDNGALTYTGNWGGTFATDKAWTTDPAWIL
ncbi:MAG TPA: host specificity protein J, partial [Maribacter sp.]|nr:host specificity protein J [Maribacter sp.]